MQLIKYEAARHALREAHGVDEVKDIRDKATALAEYARQAKDAEMQRWAAEIKIRAERKAGQLLEAVENRGHYKKSPEDTFCKSLKDLGITKIQSSNWQNLASVDEDAFEQALASPVIVTTKALAAAAKKAKKKKTQPNVTSPCDNQPELHRGDFRRAPITPGSIDWVITDPPYGKKYCALYRDLSEHAARWLRPEGSLLVMSGQSYIQDVITSLSAGMIYHWTIAYLTPGGQSAQLWARKVNTFWKPVLWYVGKKYDGPWVGDVCKSATNDNDKTFHDWGQSESGFADLMKRFCRPGDVVCDPMMGAGTTGAVAMALGCRFIGAEINAESYRTARSRLCGK